MTSYVVAGYSVTLGGIVAYAGWVLLRERALRREVPQDEK